MIEITKDQFCEGMDGHLNQVLLCGDILSVDTGTGKVIMMEEAEYKILREALVALFGSDGLLFNT